MFTFIDREVIIQHNLETLNAILMQPGSPRDIMIASGAGFVALTIALSKVHTLGSSQSGSLISGMFVAAVGTFGLIEIYAATEILLVPYFGWESVEQEVIVGSLLVSFFLMVAPFTRILFHSGYWTSIGAWVIGAICAGLVIFAVSTTYEEKRSSPTKAIQNIQHQLDLD